MKETKEDFPAIPHYQAWLLAEKAAADLERQLAQTAHVWGRGRHVEKDPQLLERAAQQRSIAASLFHDAMREMNDAVEHALARTHRRLG